MQGGAVVSACAVRGIYHLLSNKKPTEARGFTLICRNCAPTTDAATASVVAHHFIFDPIVVIEIKPATRLVIVVFTNFESRCAHLAFGVFIVVDNNRQMVKTAARCVAVTGIVECRARAIKREVAAFSAPMDRLSAGFGIALPTDMPAKDLLHPGCGGAWVGDGDICMFQNCTHLGSPVLI